MIIDNCSGQKLNDRNVERVREPSSRSREFDTSHFHRAALNALQHLTELKRFSKSSHGIFFRFEV